MRIIFMGTPEFAVPALRELIAGHEVVAVYSQPPRPAGRGQKERKSPVHTLAEEKGIPVHTPVNLRNADDVAQMKSYGAELAVVAAYGLLLPESVLNAFPHGCINIHPSLLPRWRGAAPIQRTVLAGDTETAICIMQMEKGLDTGPILKSMKLVVKTGVTSGELHDELSEKSAGVLLETIRNIDSLKPEVQSTEGVTYAKKIEKTEAKIDWNKPAKEIDQLIRGLNPFPGAYFEYQGVRVKIHKAEIVQGGGITGAVLDDVLTIACDSGAIRPVTVQKEGGKPIALAEFLRGTPIAKGTQL